MALDGKAPIVGRQRELAQVRAFLSTPGRARTLVIGGEPGIGKTTVWEAAIDLARELGWRVLSARPSAAEAQPSFAALTELCEAIGTRTLSALPAPQRLALDVALLRTRPTDMAPHLYAVALGFLNAVRALTADGPVLIAVDDLPWARSAVRRSAGVRRAADRARADRLRARATPGRAERARAGPRADAA